MRVLLEGKNCNLYSIFNESHFDSAPDVAEDMGDIALVTSHSLYPSFFPSTLFSLPIILSFHLFLSTSHSFLPPLSSSANISFYLLNFPWISNPSSCLSLCRMIVQEEAAFRNISIINPADVTIRDTIGQGQFAIVKKGVLTNESNPDGIEVCFLNRVKVLGKGSVVWYSVITM